MKIPQHKCTLIGLQRLVLKSKLVLLSKFAKLFILGQLDTALKSPLLKSLAL